jgi:hypothetical protein
MFGVSETVAYRRLFRNAAMVGVVVPVVFLAACAPQQPAPPPAQPVEAAPPPPAPAPPPPAPLPPARG